MSALSLLRISARVALPLGIASSAVAIAAAPALAASSVSVTGDSSGVVDHQTTLSIVGHYDNSGSLSSKTVKLIVTDPGGTDHTLWTGTAGPASTGNTSAVSFSTDCDPWTSPCAEAVNGSYAFRVDVGSTQSSATTIRFNVPPAQVQGFGGSADGTVATFSWKPNTEPDLVDYDLQSGGSDVTPGGLDPSSVCDSSGCSVSVQFGSGVSGTQQQYVMVARRRSASGGLLDSPDATTTVTFPAAPSPAPSGQPGSTGGGGGTSGGGTGTGGGSTSGGGAGGTTKGGHTLGKHPAADLRSYLPTVTAGNAPDLPSVITEVKPLPMGTYKPLVYPDQVKREAVRNGRNGVAAAVVGDLANVVDSGPLWRALAGAAVLMLVAAHLRAWVERTDVAD
ncbi:MAG TPA: hypothetical protein VFH66_05550 [Mycobacteriales bacterium]|nr:hypothetical protein [Mycobacteriales bacterium]